MKLVSACLCVAILLGQSPLFADGAAAVANPAHVATTEVVATSVANPAARDPLPDKLQSLLADHQLPKLLLRWDCGNCVHNDKVLPLIEQDYANEAKVRGYTVSDGESAEVVITAYRQRNPAVRVMFGIMAGPDILSTRVVFRGKEFVASDYSANSFFGMNSLCDAVSKKAIGQILSGLTQR